MRPSVIFSSVFFLILLCINFSENTIHPAPHATVTEYHGRYSKYKSLSTKNKYGDTYKSRYKSPKTEHSNESYINSKNGDSEEYNRDEVYNKTRYGSDENSNESKGNAYYRPKLKTSNKGDSKGLKEKSNGKYTQHASDYREYNKAEDYKEHLKYKKPKIKTPKNNQRNKRPKYKLYSNTYNGTYGGPTKTYKDYGLYPQHQENYTINDNQSNYKSFYRDNYKGEDEEYRPRPEQESIYQNKSYKLDDNHQLLKPYARKHPGSFIYGKKNYKNLSQRGRKYRFRNKCPYGCRPDNDILIFGHSHVSHHPEYIRRMRTKYRIKDYNRYLKRIYGNTEDQPKILNTFNSSDMGLYTDELGYKMPDHLPDKPIPEGEKYVYIYNKIRPGYYEPKPGYNKTKYGEDRGYTDEYPRIFHPNPCNKDGGSVSHDRYGETAVYGEGRKEGNLCPCSFRSEVEIIGGVICWGRDDRSYVAYDKYRYGKTRQCRPTCMKITKEMIKDLQIDIELKKFKIEVDYHKRSFQKIVLDHNVSFV